MTPILQAITGQPPVSVFASARINQPANIVYPFVRDAKNLPRIASHLPKVEGFVPYGEEFGVTAVGWFGGESQWEVEILRDLPNRRIAWRAHRLGSNDLCGSIDINPNEDAGGVDVVVRVRFLPPVQGVGRFVLAWFWRLLVSQQLQADLLRLRSLLEESRGPALPVSRPLRREGQKEWDAALDRLGIVQIPEQVLLGP